MPEFHNFVIFSTKDTDMPTDSTARAGIALTLLPRLNSRLCLPLLERCGGPEGFFLEKEALLSGLCGSSGLAALLSARTRALEEAEREMELMDRYGISLCTFSSPGYPSLLSHCEDAPLAFYYKGRLETDPQDLLLAVVGTRKSSVLCRDRVDKVLAELGRLPRPPIIVSGLAYGIDAAAHRASLEHGLRTLAVLGHGLHRIYPAPHQKLAGDILEADGCLISEFPCLSRTYPSNFLRRNRIIAGLSHATLVAESAVRGGAMSTARMAFSYSRDVMAFPGRPEDPGSAGCNLLIKGNLAALVEDGRDIARILDLHPPGEEEVQLSLDFSGDLRKDTILDQLRSREEVSMDALALLTGIAGPELSSLLLEMELEGRILSLPGKRYRCRK